MYAYSDWSEFASYSKNLDILKVWQRLTHVFQSVFCLQPINQRTICTTQHVVLRWLQKFTGFRSTNIEKTNIKTFHFMFSVLCQTTDKKMVLNFLWHDIQSILFIFYRYVFSREQLLNWCRSWEVIFTKEAFIDIKSRKMWSKNQILLTQKS